MSEKCVPSMMAKIVAYNSWKTGAVVSKDGGGIRGSSIAESFNVRTMR